MLYSPCSFNVKIAVHVSFCCSKSMGDLGGLKKKELFFRSEGNDCLCQRHILGYGCLSCIGFNILAGFGGGRNVPFFLFRVFVKLRAKHV